MEERYCAIMSYIMERAGAYGCIETSTTKLAKALQTSQQTVSRKLIAMEARGLIKRQVTAEGVVLRFDSVGIECLKNCYSLLMRGFEKKPGQIRGEVRTGLGEGRYYMSLPGYRKQFREKLGFVPYEGTLNLFVRDSEKLHTFISSIDEILIQGFETRERSYGSLRAYRVKINNIAAAIIMPERARQPRGIFEVIAPVNIREKLRLREKRQVVITC